MMRIVVRAMTLVLIGALMATTVASAKPTLQQIGVGKKQNDVFFDI